MWDFRTDQANGEIKCLSLTSRAGGDVGLHDDESETYNNKHIGCVYTREKVYGHILGRTDNGVYAFIANYDGKNVMIRYDRSFARNCITLSRATDKSGSNISSKTIPLSWDVRDSVYTRSADAPIVYVAKYNSNNIWYAKINYATGTLIIDTSVVLSVPSNYSTVAYLHGVNDDGIYVGLYDRTITDDYNYVICKFTHTGTYIGRATPVRWYNKTSSDLYNIGDRWYIGDYGITDTSDRSKIYSNSNGRWHGYDAVSTMAPLYISGADKYSCTVIINLYNNYIATINNLATPVTKTSALTMKITYDLIQS